jgi:hypothetical protein
MREQRYKLTVPASCGGRKIGDNRPMGRPRTYSAINAAKFRVIRAAVAWDELVEVLRSAAAEPGYCGPDLRAVEWLGGEIATVRLALREWAIKEVLRRRRTRKFRTEDGRAILQAINKAAVGQE